MKCPQAEAGNGDYDETPHKYPSIRVTPGGKKPDSQGDDGEYSLPKNSGVGFWQ